MHARLRHDGGLHAGKQDHRDRQPAAGAAGGVAYLGARLRAGRARALQHRLHREKDPRDGRVEPCRHTCEHQEQPVGPMELRELHVPCLTDQQCPEA